MSAGFWRWTLVTLSAGSVSGGLGTFLGHPWSGRVGNICLGLSVFALDRFLRALDRERLTRKAGP